MFSRIPIFPPFAALIALTGCRPTSPAPAPVPKESAPVAAQAPGETAGKPSPPSPVSGTQTAEAPRLLRKTIAGIEFEGVSFDSMTHRLAVVDQPGGPGSEYDTAADVARRHSTLLAINAGFFTPEGKPLGLLVSDGKAAGAWNSSSSLGNGIYREGPDGSSSISRRSSRATTSGAAQLLQAGPLLVENGKRINGLDGSKIALRSLVLTDGGRRWWIGKTSPCSLAALGSALASASPAPWEVSDALNLDGGRSTDLYISSGIPGGPVNRRSFFNRPVRNFLVLGER